MLTKILLTAFLCLASFVMMTPVFIGCYRMIRVRLENDDKDDKDDNDDIEVEQVLRQLDKQPLDKN
jgi:hypothetical protein